MKIGHKYSIVAAALVLTACTTPVLIEDVGGGACHQNYQEVRRAFGAGFARPCASDVDQHTGIVETRKADAMVTPQAGGLMQAPESFGDGTGIYTRGHIQDGSTYYWMLPYPVMHAGGVLDQSHDIEARWHSAHKNTVRLFVYQRFHSQDITSIRFEIDGVSSDYIATWPAESLRNAGRKNGSLQYFDVPYAVAKTISQAHQAQAWISDIDGNEQELVLVQQGEPSLAAQGLRRLFNAIESR